MSVRITIKGDGLSLEKQTSLKKAGQIITFLGLEEGDTTTEQVPSSPKALVVSLGSSPKVAIHEAKAKTNAQKITVLANYLSEKDGQEGVLVKEILLQLRKIGEEPGNFTRDLGTAESLRYLYPLDAKKTIYGVTDKGKGAILNKFVEETPNKTSRKDKRGFKKAIPPRQEVLSLPIVANLEGYSGFHDLPTKADSILWVLAYADSNNIEELTPREVEMITDKLRKKIPQKDFSAHNKKNMKLGYVALTDGKYKLQQKGIDHLKSLSTKQLNDKEEK